MFLNMKRKEPTHSEDPNIRGPSSLTSPHLGDYEDGTQKLKGNGYEVFLSFRGTDIRRGFVDFLYNSLVDAGIHVYSDNNELRVGEEIGPSILYCITQSIISIPIISEDYASSKWCLLELTQMLKCRRSSGQVVLPIFYKVEPSQLHGMRGRVRDAINAHKKNLDKMIVKEWEDALREASSLKGWELEKVRYCEAVKHISKEVLLELRRNRRLLDSKLVSCEVGGVDDRSVRRRITSWQKVKLLGKGSFGHVYEALTDDGFSFAVKEVSLLDEGHEGKQSLLYLEQEISLLSQLQHDNIVRYYGTKKDDEKLCLYLELMTKGSLVTLYKKDKLSDSRVSAYVRQILNGLKYLHDQSLAHRDIKCANILVDASGSVKLADFGLAKVIKMNDANSFKGSAYWMAPEVFNTKNEGYGLEADIWSLGCTVLEMFICQPPYFPLLVEQALYKIFMGELPPVPDFLSRDARDFILRCLQVNPDNRPSAAELLDHPFVRNASSSFASPHFNNVRS